MPEYTNTPKPAYGSSVPDANPTQYSQNISPQYSQTQTYQPYPQQAQYQPQAVPGANPPQFPQQNVPYAQPYATTQPAAFPNQPQQYPNSPSPAYPVQTQPFASAPGPQAMPQAAFSVANGQKLNRLYFFENRSNFIVKQRYEIMESLANAAGFDCVEVSNKYDVYDAATGENLLYVKEHSDMFMRCCCKPNHTAKLAFHDTRHPSFQPKGAKLTDPSVVMVVDKPLRLNCCPCISFFQQTQSTVVDGKFLGSSTKVNPCQECSGCFTPELNVADKSEKNYAKVVGPFCCVGGVFEIFSSIAFDVFLTDKENKIGDGAERRKLAHIQKKKPEGANKLQEATGDADQFFLELKESYLSSLVKTPEERNEKIANLFGTLLLLDYLFYEGGPPFHYNPADGSCSVNCFECYVFGCLCSCSCSGGGNNNTN
eukprot:maker-scaffold_18-snap-gene-2.63-mRNA-1 protein AED:0.00 eAED:0.00 QI:63/1/1/1/1/1/2/370/426